MEKGTVIKSTGSWYNVLLKDNTVIKCRIKGKFRLQGLRLTNPVAVGDIVEIEKEKKTQEEVVGIIKTICPRRNYIVRESPRRAHHLHLIASNIDQALLFVTIKEPMLKPAFIDRFLLTTEPHNIPVYIIVNKADLYDEEDLEMYEGLQYIYERIGYKVLLVSALKKQGLEELRTILKDKTTLVSGQSGVGKSSLINNIQPELNLRTLEISDYSGKGQHTTTFAEMHTLNFGGYIIDTPGIKMLSFINLEPMDVAHNFREFFKVLGSCKFTNCLHLNEPNCAVKAAVESEDISSLRYQNYVQILTDIQDQNYWERHKQM